MSVSIFGDIRSLKPSDKTALDKLLDRRSNPHEIINADLARRFAALAAHLGVQLGALIGRDGRLTHLVVGSKNSLYLPDLGRFRVEQARLRKLRLVVFLPDPARLLAEHPYQPFYLSDKKSRRGGSASAVRFVKAPDIPKDFITDLEKLRLDCVLVVAVTPQGEPGAVSFAHIEPPSAGSRSWQDKAAKRGQSYLQYFENSLTDFAFDFEEFIVELEKRFVGTVDRSRDAVSSRALLVGAYAGTESDAQSSMTELMDLARTAGIEVVDTIIQRRRTLDPKTVIGKGKVEEVVLHALDLGVDFLVFDRELSPGQLRSITNLTEFRVIDRSMLILDIFAQRAVSSEGRLQVELAQLKYSLPRLTEKDTGLSRLSGGIGGRGPGETKLEVGRRRIRDRLADLERRIDKLAQQRALRRERRQERGLPVFAIVGYTNAGKSTLLNTLTKSNVLAESKLFATLDPSSRRLRFPSEKEVIFVDTVGFIRELPEELLAAFRATLEEVAEADFLVHVVDATNPELRNQIQVVEETLASLGIGDKPSLLVLNKTDLLSDMEQKSLLNSVGGLAISATSRIGLDTLTKVLESMLTQILARKNLIASGAASPDEESLERLALTITKVESL